MKLAKLNNHKMFNSSTKLKFILFKCKKIKKLKNIKKVKFKKFIILLNIKTLRKTYISNF